MLFAAAPGYAGQSAGGAGPAPGLTRAERAASTAARLCWNRRGALGPMLLRSRHQVAVSAGPAAVARRVHVPGGREGAG